MTAMTEEHVTDGVERDENGRRIFNLPGVGLKCRFCGCVLPNVNRTKTTEGFVVRERRCVNPDCLKLNTTDERVIDARDLMRIRETKHIR